MNDEFSLDKPFVPFGWKNIKDMNHLNEQMTLQVFVNDILSVRKSWVDSIAKFFETHDMRDNTLTL